MNNPRYIIIHHSLTKDSETVSWGAIRRYHTKELGWADIGYHFGIEQIGEEYEILMGRMPDQHGAHCKQHNMNTQSIGICCVGNFDDTPPVYEQWMKCLMLCRYIMQIYNIPASNVFGHREFADYKTCPGTKWDMNRFRMLLNN